MHVPSGVSSNAPLDGVDAGVAKLLNGEYWPPLWDTLSSGVNPATVIGLLYWRVAQP